MGSISFAEPVVRSYFLYSSILAAKILTTAFLTARVRYIKNVFASDEDAVFSKEEDATKKKNLVRFDPDVERVRRAHLNDLENIPVFWMLGALYLTTGPSTECATILFRVYTASRVIHTIVYAVKPMPLPWRFIAFGISFLIMCYMGIKGILHYIDAM